MILSRTTLTVGTRQSIENIEAIRLRRQRAAEELSSGVRVRRPSDGPLESGEIVETQSNLSALAQLRTNLQGAGQQLRTADSALNQAIDLVTRAKTLASQGSNFNQTAATRAAMASEVEGLLQGLVGIANTSLGGKFLFAGSNEDVQPFVPDSISPDGVIYRGDQARRAIAFPGGVESPIAIDGQMIFLSPDSFRGSGRTAGTVGSATPAPPAGVGLRFSGGLSGSITANLPSFFVAATPPTVPAAGDQVTVNFTSTDGSITASITTAPFAGGETTAQIAAALNAQIAATPALAGKVTFSDQGGNLKLVESDTVGVGFAFTASATGGLVTGLGSGSSIGGLSAQEIAAALNTQVALDPALRSANVRFSVVGGEVEVDGDVDFTFTAADFSRGTGFVSGLAGAHTVGGLDSANVFRGLKDLRGALLANDADAIRGTIDVLERSVRHLSNVQAFYGAAQQQAQSSLDSIARVELANQEKLSALRDADLVAAASELGQTQVAEQAALQVAAQQNRRSLFDFLA